jgi:hypothetical protein
MNHVLQKMPRAVSLFLPKTTIMYFCTILYLQQLNLLNTLISLYQVFSHKLVFSGDEHRTVMDSFGPKKCHRLTTESFKYRPTFNQICTRFLRVTDRAVIVFTVWSLRVSTLFIYVWSTFHVSRFLTNLSDFFNENEVWLMNFVNTNFVLVICEME